ncbi:hypothetical protein JCM3766R1_005846 [Sporobolomyces carnicolor]
MASTTGNERQAGRTDSRRTGRVRYAQHAQSRSSRVEVLPSRKSSSSSESQESRAGLDAAAAAPPSTAHSSSPPLPSLSVAPPVSPRLRPSLPRGLRRRPASPEAPPSSPSPPSVPSIPSIPSVTTPAPLPPVSEEPTLRISLPPRPVFPNLPAVRASGSSHSETQRYRFPPSAATTSPAEASPHGSNASTSFPFPDSASARHVPNVYALRSAFSDWGTSIVADSSGNLSHEESIQHAPDDGKLSALSSPRRLPTDPSAAKVPKEATRCDVTTPRLLRRSRTTSQLALAFKTPSPSPLAQPPGESHRHRGSVPGTVRPLHTQFTKANVESLVTEFGYSDTLARFIMSTLAIPDQPRDESRAANENDRRL